MKTIKTNTTKTFIIKKSKFIAKTYFINSCDEANNILKNLKIEFADATHICYAFVCDNIIKFCDDGEPSNTAGMPMLNILNKNELNHTLAVVIRYFGGIKLGSGGLLRAYSNCIADIVKDNIIEETEGYLIQISFSYQYTKDIEYILKNIDILSKEYNELTIFTFLCEKNDEHNLKKLLEKYVQTYKYVQATYIRKNP